MALKQANQPFWYTTSDGVEHFVEKNSLVDAADPMLKGREALFDDVNPRSPQRTRVVVDVPDIES